MNKKANLIAARGNLWQLLASIEKEQGGILSPCFLSSSVKAIVSLNEDQKKGLFFIPAA